MRKAQMEILGMTVVVLLVAIGIFFAVGVFGNKDSLEMQKHYTNTEMATNFMNTLLSGKLYADDCFSETGNPLTIKNLLKDCVESTGVICRDSEGNNPPPYSPQIPHCDKAKDILENEILENTLDAWNKPYVFTVTGGADDISIPDPDDNPCTGEERDAPAIYPLPVSGSTLTLKLEICD